MAGENPQVIMDPDQTKIRDLLQLATSQEATDIHLVVDRPPIFRIHGNLTPLDAPPLTENDIRDLLFPMLNEKQMATFMETKELDFSYFGLKGFQFRVNAHFEKGTMAATFRITSSKIASMAALGLPPVIEKLAMRRKGLIIFSGTAGSGKTTTLSSVVDLINSKRKCKIVTIEDPIEYIHKSRQSLIVQREVGVDTQSFASALKYALRQDPDVVVIGEIRDLESISMAITTAETGHLVITTVHSPDSVETINRIIDVYPSGRREQLYAQLAENLIAVIGHTLVPRKDGTGRILATEVLLGTLPIRNIIRRGALMEIRGQLDSEDEETHTLEKCLINFVRKGIITEETAHEYAKYPDMLKHQEDPFAYMKPQSTVTDSMPASNDKSTERKILIIDNFDRNDMIKNLTKYGFKHVTGVSKGREGFTRAMTENPDIVIIDVGLFDVDGFDLCRQIKRTSKVPTKVIMITGRLQENDLVTGRQAGADEFVVKTSAYEVLIKAIHRISNDM